MKKVFIYILDAIVFFAVSLALEYYSTGSLNIKTNLIYTIAFIVVVIILTKLPRKRAK